MSCVAFWPLKIFLLEAWLVGVGLCRKVSVCFLFFVGSVVLALDHSVWQSWYLVLEGSLMLVTQVLQLSGVPMSRILKRVRKERKGHYANMHDFFPGETTDLDYIKQDKVEFMHAVILTENAYAVGKSLQQLNLQQWRVNVKGLRRDNLEIAEPDESMTLLVGDVIVITAKPRKVERAERFLLKGD